MKRFSYILLFFIVLLASCSSKHDTKDREKGVIKVDIAFDSKIKLSELSDSVQYIPLETADSSLVGIVERFRIFGNQVCLLCDKSMLAFDAQTGAPTMVISKLGNAPGEYKSLYDAYIDEKTGLVELLDMDGQRIYRYDTTGSYVDALELPCHSFSFLKIGENRYWLYNNNMMSGDIKSRFVCLNSGNIEEECFPIDTHLANFFFVVEGNNFAQRNEDLLFYFSPSDKIYSRNEDGSFTDAYRIDMGKHTLPAEFCEQNFSDIIAFSTEASKHSYVYFINNIAANDRYVQFSFFLENKSYWSVYSTMEELTHTGCLLEDDLNRLQTFRLDNLNTMFSIAGDYLYFLISAEQFIEISRDNPTWSEKVKAYDINEQSNPILVKCRLKKK